jgi:hypothetical protein
MFLKMLPMLLWRCFEHDTIRVIDEGSPRRGSKKHFEKLQLPYS